MTTDFSAQLERIEAKLDALLATIGTPAQRWMTIKQAVPYSGLCEASIRRSIDSGELTAHRPRRGLILLDVRQIDSWIQGSTARPRTGRGLHLHEA